MKTGLLLCLLSIEQAFEKCFLSDDDLDTLKAMYEHGLLYSCILDNNSLCIENNLIKIGGFLRLVESALPAPDFKECISYSLKLGENVASQELMVLPVNLRALSTFIFQEVVLDLMAVYQLAILELSMQMKDAGELSTVDAENSHYVVGMAEITLTNVGALLEQRGDFDHSDYSGLNKFFVDSTRFAFALKLGN